MTHFLVLIQIKILCQLFFKNVMPKSEYRSCDIGILAKDEKNERGGGKKRKFISFTICESSILHLN